MTGNKPRVRLYSAGQAMFRLVTRDRGYGGPYGQDRRSAWWACIDCGKKVPGNDERPGVAVHSWTGKWVNICARNGHAPCTHCGKQLPRLDDGCPRAHPWRQCPGKTEEHRMQAQHSHPKHIERANP